MLARTLPFALAFVIAGCSSDDTTPAGDGDTGISVDSTIGDVGADTRSSDARDSSSSDVGSETHVDAVADASDAHDAADTSDVSVDETSDADDAAETDDGATADTDDGASDASDALVVEVGAPCTGTGGECGADQYCDAPDCGAGICQPRPAGASSRLDPICGCDGVTYWNVQVAESVGASAHAGTGVCEPSRPDTLHCGGTIGPGCTSDETCIVERTGGSCGISDIGGQCWYVPPFAACPPTDPKPMRDCGDSTCTSYCKVLVAGDAFFEDPTCP